MMLFWQDTIYEGVISDPNGTVNNYRTRVTHIWVKDTRLAGKPSHGTFHHFTMEAGDLTSASDFEEE